MSRLRIIIPNWNGRKFLPGCLSSLETQTDPDFSCMLIDNGSEDDSVSYVRANHPWVKIRRFSKNTGFCHAVNAGIRHSHEEFVLLLNNDTVCDPHFVEEMVRAIRCHPDALCVQAKMMQLAHPLLVDDAGDEVSLLGWAMARGKDRPGDRYQRERRIFSGCAGAAIYRRRALQATGLFDERHFAYLEDVDLGWRGNLAGCANYLAPKAIVYHAGSGASGSRHNAFKVRLSSRNSVYLLYKNMPSWQFALNAPFLLCGYLIKLGYFTAAGFGREYAAGLLAGIHMCRRQDRCMLAKGHPGRVLYVQRMLVRGLFTPIR